MKTEEHTFPLPEPQLHRLDDLQHEIEETSGSFVKTTENFIQQNRWPVVAVAGLAGLAVAWFWHRNK